MSVRTDSAGDVMFFREQFSILIEAFSHTARIVNFDRINMGEDSKQVTFFPAAGPHFVVGVGNANEGALISQPGNDFLWWQTGRHFFSEEGGQDLPLGG